MDVSIIDNDGELYKGSLIRIVEGSSLGMVKFMEITDVKWLLTYGPEFKDVMFIGECFGADHKVMWNIHDFSGSAMLFPSEEIDDIDYMCYFCVCDGGYTLITEIQKKLLGK